MRSHIGQLTTNFDLLTDYLGRFEGAGFLDYVVAYFIEVEQYENLFQLPRVLLCSVSSS